MDCFVPRNDVAHNVSLRGVLNLIEEAIREKTKNKLYILLININAIIYLYTNERVSGNACATEQQCVPEEK